MKLTAVIQAWEESERGWGVRPDGYSLHLSEEDRKEYIRRYWDTQPNFVPDEYSRPSASTPRLVDLDVGDEVLAKMVVRRGCWASSSEVNRMMV